MRTEFRADLGVEAVDCVRWRGKEGRDETDLIQNGLRRSKKTVHFGGRMGGRWRGGAKEMRDALLSRAVVVYFWQFQAFLPRTFIIFSTSQE